MKRRGPASILLLVPLLLTQALPASARAGSAPAGPEFPLKSARFVVVEAGNAGPVTLGFQVELEPGWHLYWVNPGDAGLAPNARWTLPEGFTAGPLRHPVPKKAARDKQVVWLAVNSTNPEHANFRQPEELKKTYSPL